MGRRKFTDAEIEDIRTSTERQVDLARRYGVSQPAISVIRRGLTYKRPSGIGFTPDTRPPIPRSTHPDVNDND